jgi:hypothetical protein
LLAYHTKNSQKRRPEHRFCLRANGPAAPPWRLICCYHVISFSYSYFHSTDYMDSGIRSDGTHSVTSYFIELASHSQHQIT